MIAMRGPSIAMTRIKQQGMALDFTPVDAQM
jgi:hypothetical protein